MRVRVNDELVLDAGTCQRVQVPEGRGWRIEPPPVTMFRQVLDYLNVKPDPPHSPSGTRIGREGVAAAALTLRWGSYLAVLLDHDKPVSPQAGALGTSGISDEEMARINIEASAALAEWIELYRTHREGPLYGQLVDRAVSYLPMPQKTSKPRRATLSPLALIEPETADILVRAASPERLARVRADAQSDPSRLLANALVNVAWRNGPVENVHAGRTWRYSLDERRVTPTEERTLMRFASDGMALAMTVCFLLAPERAALSEGQRPWPERVLPYGLASMRLITPTGWTLTEASREIRQPVTAT
jgi:hypothetical protein